MQYKLEIQSLTKRFGEKTLFEDLNLTVTGPAILWAPSGWGKTTLLRILMGLEVPTSGTVSGVGRVGAVFQEDRLCPQLNAVQNVELVLPEGKEQYKEQIETDFIRFGLDRAALALPVRKLSGGQKRRAALLRALWAESDTLLLDEPFAALDSFLKWQLEQEIARVLADFGGPCIWVSHDRDEVYRNCGPMCMMEAGKTQPPREKHQLFQDPRTPSAARLTGCKNFVDARPQGDTDLYLPPWDVVLHVNRPVPPDITQVGLGDGCMSFSPEEETDALSCQVIHAVEDVAAMILLLRPMGSREGAPLLRMEIPKEAWHGQTQCTVYIRSPQAFLLA